MRTNKQIYEDTKQKLSDENCQSLNVIAVVAIEEAKKEWYNEMYRIAEETKDDKIIEFLEKYEHVLS
jgi:hypothetical protein